jgi:hypothetical protein
VQDEKPKTPEANQQANSDEEKPKEGLIPPALIEAPLPEEQSGGSTPYGTDPASDLPQHKDKPATFLKRMRRFLKSREMLAYFNLVLSVGTMGTLVVTCQQLKETKVGIQQAAHALSQTDRSLNQTDLVIEETKKQSRASETSAQAAVNGIDLTVQAMREAREDTRFQKRPFMAFEHEGIETRPLDSSLVSEITVKNVGESPATALYARAFFVQTENQAREAAELLSGPIDSREAYTTVGRDRFTRLEVNLISHPYRLPTIRVPYQFGPLYLVGRVRYKDIFGTNTYSSGICLTAGVQEIRNGKVRWAACGFGEYAK